MQLPSITALVGNEIEGKAKWDACVRGADDCIYGIPLAARRVVKFDPADKSLKEIGPDLGDGRQWCCGILAGNGRIYCLPHNSDTKILQIDTVNATVTILDTELPEIGDGMWSPGALAHDGCIYFMPYNARRILKFNPEDESAVSVGEHLGDQEYKFSGTVRGNDGYLCGIPSVLNLIVRFNPIDQSMSSLIVEEFDEAFECDNGTLGRDGYIYAMTFNHGLLRIDVTNNTGSLLWNEILAARREFGPAILGNDGCIYWLPIYDGEKTLKFDPETQVVSFVGNVTGTAGGTKWTSGAAGADGAIYCMPFNATRVLVIDPFQEFKTEQHANMEQQPDKLGCLFDKNEDGKTFYECSVTKFGFEKVFQVIAEDCSTPLDIFCARSNLDSFIMAAACDNSSLSVIYGLLRKNLDSSPLVNYHAIADTTKRTQSETPRDNKKRKAGLI